ncbi:hypothetical protein BJ912DRAFT_460225 [Pholiota molesta]|nr:hypothetical protein BJ912DRAFT_460225 [Pholiota molesta]
MPPSMEERPAFARSAPSLFTSTSTTTSSNYDAGSQPFTSRDRPASLRGERPSASPTLSAGSHASRIIRMLVGERRRAAEHEHPSAEAAEPCARGSSRVSGDATESSAELGRRTRPKSSKPLKNPSTRKSRRSTIPRPRLNLFSASKKPSPTTSHAQPAPAPTQSLVRPRVPGVFVPSLPEELWLLIFKYAAYPPFVALPPTSSNAVSARQHPTYTRAYPYPTTYDPHSEAVSFLQHPMAHAHLPERLAAYRAQMRAKAALRCVCRVWSAVAEEVLYEFVWVASAKQGRELAGKLGGDVEGVWIGASVSVGGKAKEKEKETRKGKEGNGGFGRKGKKVVDAASIVSRKSSSYALAPPSVGRWVKRLHIETPALDLCSPHDLLLILQNCPNVVQFADYRSVRRPMHPLMLSLSDVAPFSVAADGEEASAVVAAQRRQQQALLTPDALLSNLLERPLRRLTWTNYDYDASDFEAGVRFYEDIVAPRLEAMGGKLEYLELVLSGTATHGMGQRAANVWGVGGACEVGRRVGTVLPTLSRNPAQAMYGAANMLTELEAAYTSTSTTVHAPALASLPTTPGSGEPILSVEGFAFALRLPALKTLKATLDNATFLVLSTWDMPQLTHLSIVAADFGYAAPGFRRFFEVHGAKLTQLELGHSSGAIEEAWVTEPPPSPTHAAMQDAQDITLEAWCPALTEFICSADAEWNWQRPDWIAPHVLLPAHAGVQFIGVRDMEKRLLSDLDEALRRRRGDGLHPRAGALDDPEGWENWGDDDEDDYEDEDEDGGAHREDDPYFALLQQFGSLLRSEAFPALRYVRDMSWESDIMRRTCRMRPLPPSAAAAASASPPPEPQPLEAARHTPYAPFMHQHWWSTAAWAQAAAGGGKAARESQARKAAREAEEALARAYGRRMNVFWRRVARMCRRRGVWLEDCFGVNVTKANLKQAAAQ